MGQIQKLSLPKASSNAAMERETGIEPASLAWKARVLPLNYSRIGRRGSDAPATPKNGIQLVQTACLIAELRLQNQFIAGGEGWIRTSVLVRGQIYSLLPLTTRPPLLWRTSDYAMEI
jgi:hypothetical protein